MGVFDSLTGLLAPPHCGLCGAAASPELPLCPACIAGLPWNRVCCPHCALPQAHSQPCADCARKAPAYTHAWCAFRLEQPVQSAVHALKYGARFLQAHSLGHLMAGRLAARAAPLPDLLIPVPLHRARLRRRGYNQALELARVIAERLHLPVDAEACERTRPTQDQIGMSAGQRQRNVRGAFRTRRQLEGLHVAVLDDVMTTGATLSELARICRKAGAARVEVWAAARVA